MNEYNNVNMEQEKEEKKEEEKYKNIIKKEYFIFPRLYDKNKEIEYNKLRIHNIKEYICIHLTVSLFIILIECFVFTFNLNIKDTISMEICVVIFSILNCLMHIVVLIKMYFFTSENVYIKGVFIGYILLNQIFQFLSLYFFTKRNEENKNDIAHLKYYDNRFNLYLHFFVDSVFILCLPALSFCLSVFFMIMFVCLNMLLINIVKFNKVSYGSDIYHMCLLSVVLLMVFILRYMMEERNRLLFFFIKDMMLDNYRKWYAECMGGHYDKDKDSMTVDVDNNKYKKENDENYKFLFSNKCILFHDFTLNGCYKDYYSMISFLRKLLKTCNLKENINENTSVNINGYRYENMNCDDNINSNIHKNYNSCYEELKKNLNESDILTIAYEVEVLKNIKKINSDEIGKNWDYSFIDSEYGKSTLVILEVGYHLISPYIENNENKRKKLQLFLLLINSMYFPNPYHNANHGATVCHLSKCLAHITDYDSYLNNTYMICYLIASIAHDVGHPGKTNSYLSETNHILSIRYNDMSILENYHCSITFSILQLIGFDFLINNEDTKLVEKNKYTNMRKFIIELIISTDMKLHFEYVDIFKKRKKSQNFDISDRDAINLGTINIKLADIGHTCLKWKDHAKWTMLVSEEFFSQKKVEELHKNKNRDPLNFPHFGKEENIDEGMIFNYENIYINYINNINNINTYDYSYIKLNFIHHHDFVKSIPSTQVYFFEIIVMPLIKELQSMEKAKKEITQKVLHNLNINLKTWRLIEKNINLFYNTEKMTGTDYYKNLEKQKLLRGIRLLDIAEEDVISLTENFKEEIKQEKS
ncbi:putative phosphodiesterase delta [Plasmodium gaboni]|uniref:Phosphodiesterase n=1 Tax=Plasmodium gaboni TaxID=647221 RepID=A0A151LBE3_9APIC|nr:putative phosphodiesterase delta [Plasmodium gaboni]KYN96290.1 putative phosphodiesterase delta [Plasmodium gaboni]